MHTRANFIHVCVYIHARVHTDTHTYHCGSVVLPLAPTPSTGWDNDNTTLGLAIGLGAGLPLLLILCVGCYMRQKARKARGSHKEDPVAEPVYIFDPLYMGPVTHEDEPLPNEDGSVHPKCSLVFRHIFQSSQTEKAGDTVTADRTHSPKPPEWVVQENSEEEEGIVAPSHPLLTLFSCTTPARSLSQIVPPQVSKNSLF